MKKTIGITTGVVALGIGAVIFLASPESPAQTPSASALPIVSTVSVTNYQLISERRISRTVSDFTYRVTVRNAGPDLIVVTGTVTSSSSATTFPDGTASFGDVASSTPANSTDTITLRQDRTVAFSTSQLRWTFRAAPGEGIPPDPGPANDLTVAGIDSDNDGVRDDVERYIATTYPSSARKREALKQMAEGFNAVYGANTSRSAAVAVILRVGRGQDCTRNAFGPLDVDAWYPAIMALEAMQFSTSARWAAYREFNRQLRGYSEPSIPYEELASKCALPPGQLPN